MVLLGKGFISVQKYMYIYTFIYDTTVTRADRGLVKGRR